MIGLSYLRIDVFASAVGVLWAILVSSIGLFADGYDLMVVDLVLAILSTMYPEDMTAEKKGIMVALAYAGILAGMLFFGVFSDVYGHKTAGLFTSALMVLGCLSAACCTQVESFSLAYQLGLCRFFLGLGVGGEYPVSMTIGSGKNAFHEAGVSFTPEQVLMLNAMLFHVGSLLAPGLGSILFETGLHRDFIWRALLLFGMIPSVCTFFARMWLPSHSAEQAGEDVDIEPCRTAAAFGRREPARGWAYGVGQHWPVLLGCCLTWASQNFVFFGQASFRSVIEERLFGGMHTDRVQLAHDAHFGLFMTLFAVLGVVFAIAVVTKIGALWTQLISFFGISALAGVCAMLLGPVSSSNGVVFLTLCLWNIPLCTAGAVCYMIPSRSFPAQVQATCCGIAAAAAKVGALFGTGLFPLIVRSQGLPGLMMVNCIAALAGLAAAALLTPVHLPDPAELAAMKLSAD